MLLFTGDIDVDFDDEGDDNDGDDGDDDAHCAFVGLSA